MPEAHIVACPHTCPHLATCAPSSSPHTLRRDFNAFVRACEKFGRAAVPAIAAEIEGKTESEVRQYSVVFWQRNKELADWEKVWGQTLNPDPFPNRRRCGAKP